MARIAQYLITNGSLRIDKVKFPKQDAETGQPIPDEFIDGWAVVIDDPDEPATYTVPFGDEVREALLRTLTGGIIIP